MQRFWHYIIRFWCCNARLAVRSRLQPVDRVLWVWLSRLWRGWHLSLRIVKPETVIAWNRKGSKKDAREQCDRYGETEHMQIEAG